MPMWRSMPCASWRPDPHHRTKPREPSCADWTYPQRRAAAPLPLLDASRRRCGSACPRTKLSARTSTALGEPPPCARGRRRGSRSYPQFRYELDAVMRTDLGCQHPGGRRHRPGPVLAGPGSRGLRRPRRRHRRADDRSRRDRLAPGRGNSDCPTSFAPGTDPFRTGTTVRGHHWLSPRAGTHHEPCRSGNRYFPAGPGTTRERIPSGPAPRMVRGANSHPPPSPPTPPTRSAPPRSSRFADLGGGAWSGR